MGQNKGLNQVFQLQKQLCEGPDSADLGHHRGGQGSKVEAPERGTLPTQVYQHSPSPELPMFFELKHACLLSIWSQVLSEGPHFGAWHSQPTLPMGRSCLSHNLFLDPCEKGMPRGRACCTHGLPILGDGRRQEAPLLAALTAMASPS